MLFKVYNWILEFIFVIVITLLFTKLSWSGNTKMIFSFNQDALLRLIHPPVLHSGQNFQWSSPAGRKPQLMDPH